MNFILNIISLKFRILPRKLALFMGRLLGVFIYYVIPIRKNVALHNISIAFPQYDMPQRKKLLKNTCSHFGMVLIDFLRQSSLVEENIHDLVILDDETKKVLDECHGGIIMTGHLGNWEAMLPAIGLNGYPFVVVTQTQKNAGSQKFFNKIRKFANVSLIPRTGNKMKMMRALHNHKFLGLASDQNAGKHGVLISFFNKPTSIPKGAALFHLKTGMPIIVGFCILSANFKYHLSLRKMDVEKIPEVQENAISFINTKYSQILEDAVKLHPEQYFWFHRKWQKSIYN